MDREDRDRLVRIEESLKVILDKEGPVIGRISDHGERLRSLERARMIATGVIMSFGVGAAMAKDVALAWLKVKVVHGPHP